ncbi:MAG: TRAP transporter TatT component family protein [Blastocatellia bacterium]
MNQYKLYKIIAIVITSYLLSGCSSATYSETPASSASKSPTPEAIAAADQLFKERLSIEKLREAVKLMSDMRDPANRNFEVEWKFAKYSFFLGKMLKEEKESEAVFAKGRDAGKIASKIDVSRPEGHFWYAANLGELSRQSPITVGLKSVDDIRESMNIVLEIQPGYQGASAYDALGQLELKTRLTGGKAEKAAEFLEKGLSVSPDNANIKLHLAEAYFALKKDAEAIRQLNDIIKMKPHPDYLLEHEIAVQEAKKILARKS